MGRAGVVRLTPAAVEDGVWREQCDAGVPVVHLTGAGRLQHRRLARCPPGGAGRRERPRVSTCVASRASRPRPTRTRTRSRPSCPIAMRPGCAPRSWCDRPAVSGTGSRAPAAAPDPGPAGARVRAVVPRRARQADDLQRAPLGARRGQLGNEGALGAEELDGSVVGGIASGSCSFLACTSPTASPSASLVCSSSGTRRCRRWTSISCAARHRRDRSFAVTTTNPSPPR